MSERSFSVRLLANISQYQAAMAAARKSTDQFSSGADANIAKVGRTMSDVGGKMTSRLTVPLVGAGIAAVKLSTDFDSAFGQMVGLAGVPADEVDHLKESVLDLAGETARAPQELAEALYFAASAGLDSSQAMDAVTVAARAAQVGLGSTQDIVGLAASAIASYGAENITAAEATDILVSTIREGRAEPAELAGTLGRVLPIAAQLGVTFDEVGGTVAVLSNVFGDTNRTVTATQGLFVKMLSPTKQGRDALADMGTSVEELHAAIESDGLLGALELLRTKGFDENSTALRALFDDIEGFQAASALLATDQTILADTFTATANSAGSLDTALEGMDANANAMKQAWVDLQVALIQAGEVIVPIVADVASGIADLVSTFADLPPAAEKIVLAFLAIVAAAGPVLVVTGKLVTAYAAVKTAATGTALAKMVPSLAALGPAGVAAAAGVALIAVAWARTGEGVVSTAELVKRRTEEMAAAVGSLVDVMEAAGSATGGLKASLTTLIGESDLLRSSMADAGMHVDELTSIIERGGSHYEMQSNLREIMLAARELGATDTELDGLFLSLRELAQEANYAEVIFGELGATTGDLSTTTDASTVSQEAMAAAIDGSGAAMVSADESAQTLTEGLELLKEMQQEYIDSVLSAISVMFDHEASVLGLKDSYADYTQALFEHNLTMMDASKSDEEKQASADALRLEEIALAKEALGSAEAFAAEAGAIDGSAESARLQIEELLRQREMYPELREEIDGYIGKLDDIPGAVPTEVQALLDQGMYEEALRLLDVLDNPRTSTLTVHVRSVGGISTGVGNPVALARGAISDRPQVNLWGEDGLEAVLPLTKPFDLDRLVGDPRVMGPLSASMARLGAGDGMSAAMQSSLRPAPQTVMQQASFDGGGGGVRFAIRVAGMQEIHAVCDARDADMLATLSGGTR